VVRFSHFGCRSVQYELDGTVTIDAELLFQELRSGRDIVIVDVRTPPEFEAGHIPGSRLIPLHQLIARSCELATHRADPVVLVSRNGTRARLADAALRVAGFLEVSVLAGGIWRWRDLGYPVEETTSRAAPSRPM
jgi:rhodanese-related sulfurtransferase